MNRGLVVKVRPDDYQVEVLLDEQQVDMRRYLTDEMLPEEVKWKLGMLLFGLDHNDIGHKICTDDNSTYMLNVSDETFKSVQGQEQQRMTPEGKVKAKVKKVLDEVGAYYTMPVTGGYGNSGVPDFVGCLRGKFFGVECKANGGKPTALQLKHLDDIRKAGGIALVIDETNVETLRKELSHE